ncbi:hypothetical protein [Congregibacter litoralis]|uniref:Alpha/beta hydrolase family n=1 Tax=Congregibacter litoralis KT71 TaxID=314285 RepID=A4ABD4_9GAMM|nr:hypothetical protein [Congregibacter litoralis]EAQ96688.1 hypothetical protein KT71_06684 [Congregibacter litoralis KT71]
METRARFPNARFSYVGHSNGTYLLAKALESYRDIGGFAFERVVFAGSVVGKDYDWNAVITRGQVQTVLNFVATRDLVVAAFPQLFEIMPIQDLGSAGHNGFEYLGNGNFKYVSGGHGAGIDEKVWDSIADFVLDQDLVPSASPPAAQLGLWGSTIRLLGQAMPVLTLVTLVPLLLIGVPALLADAWVAFALNDWWLRIVTFGVTAVAMVILAMFVRRGFKRAGLRGALAAFLIPAIVSMSVFVASWILGPLVIEPATLAPAVVALYFMLLIWILRKV